MWSTDYRIVNNCTKLNLNLNILFLIYFIFLSVATISPCSVNPCLNGGTCSVSQLTNTYICSCNQYYYGTRCERMISRIFVINIFIFLLEINQCYSQPTVCLNQGTCVPGSNGAFSCQCLSSYNGTYCQQLRKVSSINDYSRK